MLATIAYILVVISANGSVSMQEFDDLDSCKHGQVTVGYDADSRSFRHGLSTECIPKAGYGKKQEPAQK